MENLIGYTGGIGMLLLILVAIALVAQLVGSIIDWISRFRNAAGTSFLARILPW
jgi:hypothetical protein